MQKETAAYKELPARGPWLQKNGGISGSTLKMIAVITMLTDHLAAVVFPSLLAEYGIFSFSDYSLAYMQELIRQAGWGGWLYVAYQVMRRIFGRLAFPIYCFLLVEGFEKTRSRLKYAGRLLLFALISEVPFNLAFRGNVLDTSYQNVFFTLLLGFAAIWAIDEIRGRIPQSFFQFLASVAVFLGAALAAEVCKCDYGANGIIPIVLLYLFRKNKREQILAGCVAFLWEITAPIAFVFIGFYNGRRGLKLKYVFYSFYPVHLLLLYLLARLV